jgi:polysaccharide biosynthesis/export protein
MPPQRPATGFCSARTIMLRKGSLLPLVGLAVFQAACTGGRTVTVDSPGAPTPMVVASAVGSAASDVAQGTGGAGRPIVARDLLEVTVFEAPELSRVVRVADDGVISVPLLGSIRAAGRTPRELEVALQDTLRRTYMRDPRVLVEVKEAAPQPIYVVGEVNQPGAFVPSGSERLTVLRAVAVARGPKPSAAPGRAVVLRPRDVGEPLQIPVNLNAVVKGTAPDLTLLPNDVVYVPKHTERAVALGVVDALVRLVTFRAVF